MVDFYSIGRREWGFKSLPISGKKNHTIEKVIYFSCCLEKMSKILSGFWLAGCLHLEAGIVLFYLIINYRLLKIQPLIIILFHSF